MNMASSTMKKFLFALLLLPACALAADLPASAQADADFLAVREAFRVGDAVRFEAAAARLGNSPLEPYVAYYRLRMNLDTASPAVVRAFLARPDDTPVIDRLRGEWLKLLGKREQWDLFQDEYPRLQTGDTELACYAMQMRGMKEPAVMMDARKLWLSSGKEQPESCNPPFDAARAVGVITDADVWQRVRLALEAGGTGFAARLALRLPPDYALRPASLTAAAANPGKYLAKAKLERASTGQRMVALFALRGLSRRDPDAAHDRWKKIEQNFTPDERRYFYGWLGHDAARKLNGRALEWYVKAGDAPLNDQQLTWRARAALRVLDWSGVLAAIEQMQPQQQQEDVWRYWRGRALRALAYYPEANAEFESLRGNYGFYGLLAADERGDPPMSALEAGYQPGEDELNDMLARPPTQRTLALYRMDLRTEAFKEWAWEVRNFNDKQLLAAAEIARRSGMYDRAINTAERTMQLHDFSLRYLSPYRDELREHVQRYDLEEAWVYGLMRQESRFVAKAKSRVGAAGIMQVMPATAKWVAKRLGMKDYRHALIHEVDTNLKLGTYYMKTTLGWFDGNAALASAAYNAGPGRARQWRGDIPLEGAIYVETIPFDETRDYVKKVMSNTVYYAQLFGQPQQSLKRRLGTIAAKDAVNQLPIPDER
ncbi:MAG: transglycosylase SLT domain-containing protein [Gallionellaceae bacterium]|jgi:soluble lytic murein transglycosylase|nr:transglycosylase SLT domain-containing protein [Gallionellaceae bacterium]